MPFQRLEQTTSSTDGFDFIADRRNGRGSVDFNRITPMPPWVYRQPTNLALLKKYG